MNKNEMKDKILEIVKEYVDEEITKGNIAMDESLSDLGLDSFKVIYMLLDIEEAFGIQIPDTMLSPELFESAETLCKAVEKLTSLKE